MSNDSEKIIKTQNIILNSISNGIFGSRNKNTITVSKNIDITTNSNGIHTFYGTNTIKALLI